MKLSPMSFKILLASLFTMAIAALSVNSINSDGSDYSSLSARLLRNRHSVVKAIKKVFFLKSIYKAANPTPTPEDNTDTGNDDNGNNDNGGETTDDQKPPKLLQQRDLLYQGAFRMPDGSLSYGGTAIAYNPVNNSLFMVGHDWYQQTAEISIPELVNSQNIKDLKRGTVLQGLHDDSDGMMTAFASDINQDGIPDQNKSTVKVGGHMVYKDKLYATAYVYYDAGGQAKSSHYISPLDITKPNDTKGLYQVGAMGAGFVGGYMATVPTEWQDQLGGTALTGECCIPIIGRSSYGPAVFAFNPEDLGIKNPVPVTPLVYYPQEHKTLGDWSSTNPTWNSSGSMGGIVIPNHSRSLLFFGVHGIGEFCYGIGTGNSAAACLDLPSDDPNHCCYDPSNSSKGTHGYPYVYQIWAYDLDQLAAVAKIDSDDPDERTDPDDPAEADTEPWDIKPYAVWDFDLPFQKDGKQIGGVAYDPKTGRIYISQTGVDNYDNVYESSPIVHVFTIK